MEWMTENKTGDTIFENWDDWHGLLDLNDVWAYSCLTGAIVLLFSLSGMVFYPCLKSRYYVLATNFIISFGMSCMIGVIFFQLIEVTYHNYNDGGPEKPDCDTSTTNEEEEEETFMIPAVFGFGAFTLVFDVDKIMSLILSRNSGDSDEAEKDGDEKGNYEETDFGDEKQLEAPPTPLVYRSRAGTGLSRAGLSTNPNMEQEVGGRERSISDLSAVKATLEKEEKKPVESSLAREGVTAADIDNKDTKNDDEISEVEVKKEIESTAYVAIVGSVLESIVYGLAIGSSWHRNIGFGLSVGLALIAEAIPHKISDFLQFMNYGYSKRIAALINFGTSAAMFVGISIAVACFEGTYDNNWIFGIVFGIFVYAGMGILLPELDKSIENSAQQGFSRIISLLIQNVGIAAGFVIMLYLRTSGECWGVE